MRDDDGQGNLFGDETDPVRVTVETEAGIARAALRLTSAAGIAWFRTALAALWAVAMRQLTLTVDDVWAELGREARSPYRSQMGNVFREARRKGWIRLNGDSVESRRASRHRSHVRRWQSRIYQQRRVG